MANARHTEGHTHISPHLLLKLETSTLIRLSPTDEFVNPVCCRPWDHKVQQPVGLVGTPQRTRTHDFSRCIECPAGHD